MKSDSSGNSLSSAPEDEHQLNGYTLPLWPKFDVPLDEEQAIKALERHMQNGKRSSFCRSPDCKLAACKILKAAENKLQITKADEASQKRASSSFRKTKAITDKLKPKLSTKTASSTGSNLGFPELEQNALETGVTTNNNESALWPKFDVPLNSAEAAAAQKKLSQGTRPVFCHSQYCKLPQCKASTEAATSTAQSGGVLQCDLCEYSTMDKIELEKHCSDIASCADYESLPPPTYISKSVGCGKD
ncbi:hypothetical protein BWQ96_05791 [Gracilariopsis chorda]|uniref:Uncharacterized protein n=1 Tax=Gracilariopsis chorda TaxID=448386 RepID=A0A2V3IQU5_9FLOR|nr:hypothetical protein BWQ96_05791 [Gracilariopsis chorda]|eukprot:PXF44463.1 hypothetical protein BWQ96_05791 [Gracilariopsis chorda]